MPCEIVGVRHGPPLDISGPIIELETKAAKIVSLETSLIQVKASVEEIKAKQNADAAEQASQKIELIQELQTAFHNEQAKQAMGGPEKEARKSGWRNRCSRYKAKPQVEQALTTSGGDIDGTLR